MNARFWVYVNGGPVKLLLTPGRRLQHHAHEITDEGYASEWLQWRLDRDVVIRQWARDSRDCDGRLCTGGEDRCHVDNLMAGCEPFIEGDDPETWCGVIWPAWQDAEEWQRDESAEAAGY